MPITLTLKEQFAAAEILQDGKPSPMLQRSLEDGALPGIKTIIYGQESTALRYETVDEHTILLLRELTPKTILDVTNAIREPSPEEVTQKAMKKASEHGFQM